MSSHTNNLRSLVEFFAKINGPKIPFINTSVFLTPETIEEILTAIKEDILKTHVTDIINVCGVDLNHTNDTLTRLIKTYRNKNNQDIINNLITIDYDIMDTPHMNELCSSKIIEKFEIPYRRNDRNQIASTIIIKIYDQLSVNQDRTPVFSYKIEDIAVEESDSNYYPLRTSLSFDKTNADELHGHKMYNIKINYQDNNEITKQIPVNLVLSDLSVVQFISQMHITAPAFLNADDSKIDKRITCGKIDVDRLDNIRYDCSGELWEIRDGIPWKLRKNKEIKSNKIEFNWKKYHQVIDKYGNQ